VNTYFQTIYQALETPVFQVHGSKILLLHILISFVVFSFSFKISSFLGRMANRYFDKKSVDTGVRDSIEKFVKYFVIMIAAIFSLDNLGISMSSLATFGAVLMVGIGFGLQNIASNFISGIIILIERPIKVGDIVKSGNFSGRVMDIRVRSTVIRTRDDVSIIIPNSKLVSEEVINESYSGENIRYHVRVGVAYDADVDVVIRNLKECAMEQSEVLRDPPPIVVLEEFGPSSLNFDLRFWCSNIWMMEMIAGEIRLSINKKFNAAGIVIPFPQQDVYLKK
jgi:small-conductance mechanosensitive channel